MRMGRKKGVLENSTVIEKKMVYEKKNLPHFLDQYNLLSIKYIYPESLIIYQIL